MTEPRVSQTLMSALHQLHVYHSAGHHQHGISLEVMDAAIYLDLKGWVLDENYTFENALNLAQQRMKEFA